MQNALQNSCVCRESRFPLNSRNLGFLVFKLFSFVNLQISSLPRLPLLRNPVAIYHSQRKTHRSAKRHLLPSVAMSHSGRVSPCRTLARTASKRRCGQTHQMPQNNDPASHGPRTPVVYPSFIAAAPLVKWMPRGPGALPKYARAHEHQTTISASVDSK